MKIEVTDFGYWVYIYYKGVPESFRIDVDLEFGVNVPATGNFKMDEDKEALIEGIEMAYKLFHTKIKIIGRDKNES